MKTEPNKATILGKTALSIFIHFNHCHFVKGTESYYNDNAVANVLNQVHEVSILKCALKCLY